MKTRQLSILITCILTCSAFADSGIPSIVTDGLNAYQKSGGRSALETWLKNSPLRFNSARLASLTTLFRQAEETYERMIGFEPIRTVTIAPSAKRVYVLMKFEHGPLYAWFDCYKGEGDWIIPMLDFDVRANRILPYDLLGAASEAEPN